MRPIPVLAAAALAGCLATPASELASASDAADAGTFPWQIDRCDFVIAAVKAPAATLNPLLPPGFSAISTAGVGEIHFDAYRCEAVSWLGGATLADAGYASVYVPVVAPPALRESGYGNYFVKFDTLVADSSAQALLAAAGLPARAGDATVALAAAPGGSSAVQASADLGDVGFTILGAAAPGQAQGGTLPFIEHTPLETGGLARWHATLHDAVIGPGAGVVELRGWPAEALGVDRAPATLIAGTWNLDRADVAWPIAWP